MDTYYLFLREGENNYQKSKTLLNHEEFKNM